MILLKVLRLSTALLLASSLSTCSKGKDPVVNQHPGPKLKGPQVERDLAEIKEEGVIRAIAIYNSTNYFLYRGEPMGFEYELLRELTEELGLELEMVVAQNINELFDLLNSGKGDLIASGLTVTEPRRKLVAFTDYHYLTHQALVQRKPKNWRRLPGYKIDQALTSDAIELIGDTVAVPAQSSYYERLINLQQEIGGTIHLDTNVGLANTDDLIRQVMEGKIKYTVADYNIAAINKTYYPDLDIETPISFSQRIAWAVRKNSPELLRGVNEWVQGMRQKDLYYVLYNKYFKNKKSYERRVKSEFYSRNSGKISRYDSLLKRFADTLNWDWRLLGSLVYQESRFDPYAESWAGARGLMQLMPATALEMGLKNPNDPTQNLDGGVRYLRRLTKRFEEEVEDPLQRVKFAIASYNVGLGHVLDARRLAEKYGKDPSVWDQNVEFYIRKMSSFKYYSDPVVRYGFARGEEPFHYVRDIFARYQHYRKLLPEEDSTEPVIPAQN